MQDQRLNDVDKEDMIVEKQVETKDENSYTRELTTELAVPKDLPKDWKIPKGFSRNNIIGEIDNGVSIRLKLNNFHETIAFVSQVDPKKCK